jgi:LAO/AO transport system kinase
MSSDELIDRALAGDRAALARLITSIESSDPAALEAVAKLGPAGSMRIGVTGPPGAGKSTLVASMITELRARGKTVAVLAVDPSSPVTGGALLGDRIRMQLHVDDPGVYIRSMASRGHLGGLAAAAGFAIAALSHAGFDQVLVETVGIGQSEVEVMGFVDLVVLVVAPGWGDQVQAEKAGVIEIADLVVVNKGDLAGADELRRALQSAVPGGSQVLITTATTGEGVAELVDAALDAISRPSPR